MNVLDTRELPGGRTADLVYYPHMVAQFVVVVRSSDPRGTRAYEFEQRAQADRLLNGQ